MASVNSRSKGLPTASFWRRAPAIIPANCGIRIFLDESIFDRSLGLFVFGRHARGHVQQAARTGHPSGSDLDELVQGGEIRADRSAALDQLDASLDERPLNLDLFVLGVGQRILDFFDTSSSAFGPDLRQARSTAPAASVGDFLVVRRSLVELENQLDPLLAWLFDCSLMYCWM